MTQLYDSEVERRLVAGMLTSPQVLAACSRVESADVADMRLVLLFNAIRNLGAKGLPLTELQVAQWFATVDEEQGTNYAGHCSAAFVSDVVRSSTAYDLESRVGWAELNADITWLRGLAKQRWAQIEREGEEHRDFILAGGAYDHAAAASGRQSLALQRAKFFAEGRGERGGYRALRNYMGGDT